MAVYYHQGVGKQSMQDFMESLSVEERKELLDYLHRCRYQCQRDSLREGSGALLHNLSMLLRLLEFGTPKPPRRSRG